MNHEQARVWFQTFNGMCMDTFGVRDGRIDWPVWRCQAQKVWEEMRQVAGIPPEADERADDD